MQVKRSRIARPSSFDEAGILGILNQSSRPQRAEMRWEPPKNTPSYPKSEQSQPAGILTMSSPELMRESGGCDHRQGETGHFLEKCYLCKKNMFDADVYMYGDMRGFCSNECRNKQILIDSALERSVKQSRGTRAGSSRMTDVKDHSGV